MRIRRIAFITVVTGVLLGLSSCSVSLFCIIGEGTAETFTVPGLSFTALAAANHADVVISEGSDHEVQVRAQRNIYENMDIYVSDGVLHIRNDRCVVQGPATVHVTMPTLDSATTSGTGDIQVDGFTTFTDLGLTVTGTGDIDLAGTAITAKGSTRPEADKVTLMISGTGDIVAEFDATHVDATIGGTGSMALAGSAGSQEIVLSGTGSYRAFDLATTTADVTLSGTGSAEINVADTLTGTLSGTGDIIHRGSATVTVNDTGTGAVKAE
jgi:hypothetical protein